MERSNNQKQQRYKETKHRDVFGSAEVNTQVKNVNSLQCTVGCVRINTG